MSPLRHVLSPRGQRLGRVARTRGSEAVAWRVLVLAAIVALVGSGIRLPGADAGGVSMRHEDEPVSGAPRHEGPAEDAGEEKEPSESERESAEAEAFYLFTRGGPTLEIDTAGSHAAFARACGTFGVSPGVPAIRGPPTGF